MMNGAGRVEVTEKMKQKYGRHRCVLFQTSPPYRFTVGCRLQHERLMYEGVGDGSTASPLPACLHKGENRILLLERAWEHQKSFLILCVISK